MSRDADGPVNNDAFAAWGARWLELGDHRGTSLADAVYRDRAEALLDHWRAKVPTPWQRGTDEQLLGPRYRRTHSKGKPRERSEHELEKQILEPDPRKTPTSCFGRRLEDGINAVPLSLDAGGGRNGNVEADMLLMSSSDAGAELLLVEIKTGSNHPWYAVAESLRQLRLAQESVALRNLMADRKNASSATPDLPIAAVILAPLAFYTAPGRNREGTPQAARLAATFNAAEGTDVRLATWDVATRRIDELRIDAPPLPAWSFD